MNQEKKYEAKITFKSDYPRDTIKRWIATLPMEVLDIELMEVDNEQM